MNPLFLWLSPPKTVKITTFYMQKKYIYIYNHSRIFFSYGLYRISRSFHAKRKKRSITNIFLKKTLFPGAHYISSLWYKSGNMFPWLSPFIFQAPAVASAIPPGEFSSFISLVVGLYLKISHVTQENPGYSISVDVSNTASSTSFLQMNTFFFLELISILQFSNMQLTYNLQL